MGRLTRVGASTAPAGSALSIQMCGRTNTSLTCAVLAQNSSHPASSRQQLHSFAAHTPVDGVQHPTETHRRKRPCTSCARQQVDAVFTRFMGSRPVTGRKQLSLGVPLRLSAARLVASQLHRDLCGANATCAPLEAALAGACVGDCLRRGAFLGAVFNGTEHDTPAPAPPRADSGSLWARSWVWCPPSHSADASFRQCRGSVDKATWLNPRTRGGACARHIQQDVSSTSAVNFCLLNSKTMALCEKMVAWRRETQSILCRAAGRCASTEFFYSPTTFDLREQQFVYDSVLDFYRTDAKRTCPAGAQSSEQELANEANLGRCASVHIQPLLIIVEQLREGKRMLLLIGYHWYRVQFYLVQLLVTATTDAAAAIASAGTDTLGRVADGLLREIMALMQVIGNFVDLLRDSIMELAFSRGVGKQLKDLLVFLCQVIELLHNTLWSYLLCPVLRIAMSITEFMINLLDLLLEVVRLVLFGQGRQVLDDFIATLRTMVAGITAALGTCEPKSFNCVLEPVFSDEDTTLGVLPAPTRCWASYLTFFGDNQQLSCSKADTCKLSRLSSLAERRVCGACPVQANANVRDFSCDVLTGMCTCAVPQLGRTSCFSNEDCLQAGSEATCSLINDDLEISTSSVPCDDCQYQRMCLETPEGGVCACGARQRFFHVCSQEDYVKGHTLSLKLNNLCLYTATVGVVEFSLSSVIACQELDSYSSSCAFVSDMTTYIARGFRRTRRRLLGAGDAAQDFTYQTVDSVCRDALVTDSMLHTRISCQEAFDASNATLVFLGLHRQLPPCTLCSFADALVAA